MDTQMEAPALSTEHEVREVAMLLMRICGNIHEALRKASFGIHTDNSTLSYALLTEEYALRSRANVLLIEAKRLARSDLVQTQQTIYDILLAAQARIEESTSLHQLAELINSLMLFSNALMSIESSVVTTLIDHLRQAANRPTSGVEKHCG